MTSFRIIPPSAALRGYIRYYWTLRSDSGPLFQRVMPWGCMQLCFHRRRPFFSQTHGQWQPRHYLCGQARSYTDVSATGPVDMLAVVFQPHAAKLFFRHPMSLFQDACTAIADTEDAEWMALTRSVEDAESHAVCIERIETFLLRRLLARPDPNFGRLSAAIRHIERVPRLHVDELADIACLSPKQFTRVFTAYVGASPKDFLRIIRLQRALYMWQRCPREIPAQVAYACGFADQSHMIREFKCFSGLTPGEYIAEGAPTSDYFSIP